MSHPSLAVNTARLPNNFVLRCYYNWEHCTMIMYESTNENMKRILSMTFFCLFAMMLQAQPSPTGNYVEVLYFHGRQRCLSCMAMEKYAREVVDQDFAMQKKLGKVRFREIDITTGKGKQLARSYRVTWSSLYVTGVKNGKETRRDMTRFGFSTARKKTPEFKKGLKAAIIRLLQ